MLNRSFPLSLPPFLSLSQDFPSYKFVNGIRHKIEMCSGDVVVTECNSGDKHFEKCNTN